MERSSRIGPIVRHECQSRVDTCQPSADSPPRKSRLSVDLAVASLLLQRRLTRRKRDRKGVGEMQFNRARTRWAIAALALWIGVAAAAGAAPKVIVMGGGVGGLTAAHELAERGYAVEVYE